MASQNGTTTSSSGGRWTRWVAGIAGIVAIIAGVSQVARAFTLPACDSSGIIDTVKDIFKGKGAELDEVTNARFVSDEEGKKNCAARVRGQGETAQITYQVYWDGWSKMVRIGDVNVEPAAGTSGAPSR